MQIKEYVKQSKRTCANLNNSQEDNFHMIFGMLTEVGELADVFKKNLAYKKEVDWNNVGEEIGDLMWYVANFCRMNNFDLETILDINIKKLQSRYPEKFTEEKAKIRNLEEENKILKEIGH